MCLYLCVWCALKKRRVSFCCTCAGVHQPLVCEAVCGICLSCLEHSCVFLRFNLSVGASLRAGVLKDKEREPWKVKQPSSMPACVVEMQLLQWLQSSASCGRCYNSYVGQGRQYLLLWIRTRVYTLAAVPWKVHCFASECGICSVAAVFSQKA